jgi:PAS domain S-box-containing protein
MRMAWTGLLVCGACYLGATIGNAMRFPHVGTAIFYPPYAIVAAALIGSPPRRWLIYLLAGTVGSFLPNRLSGSPLSFVLMTELANYIRVLVAAVGVRRLAGVGGRLDTLRGMAVFLLFAVLLAPALAAFVGAGVATLHGRGGGYWTVWQSWLLSNVLTGLTLLPIILTARAGLDDRTAPIPGRHLMEGGALLLALCAVSVLVVLQPSSWYGSVAASLYASLPLLLWAVRFGPLGTSASILVVGTLAIIRTLDGRAPFAGGAPAGDLLQLQLFLFVTSIPLLLMASLIQEQRRTMRALSASQQQYQTVVEDQTELICRFLADGTLTFVNDACCRALGRRPRELLAGNFWTLVLLDRHDGERSRLAALTPDRPVATWEHELTADAVGSRWQHWTVRALFDEDGQALKYQAVGSDITERKRAQEQSALLDAQRRQAEVLREADRCKDEFIALLAHELRNPLAPIVMAVEILRFVESDDDQLVTARDIIGRQTAQLAHLVDDLLEVARINTGKIQLRIATVDLVQVIAAAIETSQPLIDANGQRLTAVVPAGPLPLRGDAARLAQLVANLLNNSAKYSAAGARIELTAVREGAQLVLRFRDEGAGIPPHMLERVFESFTQVDSARDGGMGGLGLGLHLVKRLAELHGGSVRAHSDGPGRGSEFVVRLPALEEAAPEAGEEIGARAPGLEASAPAAPLGPSAPRVLVVDDIVDAADSLARFLSLQGYTVAVAHDGRAALDMAERWSPGVVFVDLGMPGIDGLEVARRLRGRSGSARALLVAMTGFGQPDDRRRTFEAGFDHHLTKPLDPGVVRSLLEGVRTAP